MRQTCFKLRPMALLLCLVLLMTACVPVLQASAASSSPSETVSAENPTDASPNYAPGDKLHGFTLIDEQEMVSPPALLRIWKHDQTGAQVYFIHNDDPDRTFSVTFRTEPSDDTGKLHILEHSVCAASEKYPGRDVFFDAAAQAYITGINASTYKSATNYYVSSMSEDQLEQLADLYLDCAFNSLLRSQPNYFYREGWRYSMDTPDAPLTIDGIVYNEMKGVYGSIYSKHYSSGLSRALFPDTYQRWDSGGDPAAIPELTYEELVAFYDKCYHPSNSISMFYGDVETARYLKLMDENYFSNFEAQPPAGYSPAQKPFDEIRVYAQDFPVSKDSSQTGGVISYAVALPEKMDYTEIVALLLGLDYMGDESSPMMQKLHSTGIGADYSADYTPIGSQYVLLFTAHEADTSRAGEFQEAVISSLTDMVENGFDREMLDAICDQQRLHYALVSDQSAVGIMMAGHMARAIDSGYMEQLDTAAYIPLVQKLCSSGGLEQLVEKYIIGNTHAALLTTTPKAGMLEEQEREQTELMAAKKAAMSEEEIEQIIADTAAFQKWNDETSTVPETLEKLRTETPDTVNVTLPVHDIEISEREGVTFYAADVEGDATYCEYLFDLSHLSTDELRTLNVYLGLLGGATEKRSQQEISIASQRLFTRFNACIQIMTCAGGSPRPSLSISFYALDDKLEEAAELIMEMFCSTDLAAVAYYFDTAITAGLQDFYNAENVADTTALAAAMAGSSPKEAVNSSIYGMDYYSYLSQMAETESSELAEQFRLVREKALIREGAEVVAIGSADGKQQRADILCALLPKPSEAHEAGDWVKALEQDPAASLAFRAGGTSSYVSAAMDITSLGLKPTGELQLLCDILRDLYLIPEFRFQLGAYGASMSISDTGTYHFRLFRAPSFTEALSRLPQIIDELETRLSEMTAEELAGYQLSRLSTATQPSGPWREVIKQIDYMRNGIQPSERQEMLNQVSSATPESLIEQVPQLRQIIDKAGYAVVAPASAISDNLDMFEQVLQLP